MVYYCVTVSCGAGILSGILVNRAQQIKGRDSSVGIASLYGLDGPGIESRWGGRDFPHPSRPALGPTQFPVQMGTGSFLGVMRPGRDATHPLPSKCRGHERVGLYLYSPSGPSLPVIGGTLPLPLGPSKLERKGSGYFAVKAREFATTRICCIISEFLPDASKNRAYAESVTYIYESFEFLI